VFHYDPTIQQLPAHPGSIAYFAESSNQPNVAVPGRQAQAAQAIVLALRSGKGMVSVFVSLYLVVDREPAVYAYEIRDLPRAGLDAAVEEAWAFCESMGFILDVVPFDSRSPVEQARLLTRLRPAGRDDTDIPIAAEPPAALTPGPAGQPDTTFTPSPAQLARLGRLLASF
jgi:hypothetical protein